MKWYMLALVGRDRPGIVAEVTNVLYKGECHLGEANMMRLGGNFSVMLMVRAEISGDQIKEMLSNVIARLDLTCHIDQIEASLHDHLDPDIEISLYGADRAGIVANATALLAEKGLNILDMQTTIAGSDQEPIYIMQIEGHAGDAMPAIEESMEQLSRDGIEVQMQQIETLIG